MYRVMIAEDEQIEREMLAQIIAEHFPSVDQIIPAENGQQAVDLFAQYQPDLILMDINMPLKSGMEALREIRQNTRKEFVCIILTSYGHFSYAQDGIRLRVDDYILKPAEDAQIITSVSAGMEKLQQRRNMHASIQKLLKHNEDVSALLESECIFAIINQKEEKMIRRYFQMARIDASHAFTLVAKAEEDNTLIPQIRGIIEELGYACMSARLNDCQILYIFASIPMDMKERTRLQYLTRPLLERSGIAYAWGPQQDQIDHFHVAFEDAMAQLHIQENVQDEHDPFVWKSVEQLLSNLEENQIAMIVYDLFEKLAAMDTARRNAVMEEILTRLYDHAEQNGLILPRPQWQEEKIFKKEDTRREVELKITQRLMEVLRPLKAHHYQSHSLLYRKAIEFIEQNYHRPIGLSDLGKALNVTPHYISRLLSKEGAPGKNTFTELLTDYRIEAAKRLIQQGVSLKNVAFEVGFHSTSYFSKSFRKNTGMTPREYQRLFESGQSS